MAAVYDRIFIHHPLSKLFNAESPYSVQRLPIQLLIDLVITHLSVGDIIALRKVSPYQLCFDEESHCSGQRRLLSPHPRAHNMAPRSQNIQLSTPLSNGLCSLHIATVRLQNRTHGPQLSIRSAQLGEPKSFVMWLPCVPDVLQSSGDEDPARGRVRGGGSVRRTRISCYGHRLGWKTLRARKSVDDRSSL